MTVSYTFDVFQSLDGFGSYDTNSGNWGGYWGKQGPELLAHRLALYSAAAHGVWGQHLSYVHRHAGVGDE
jgi:hypothetical protein